MRVASFVFILLWGATAVLAQKENPLMFDHCSEDISASVIKDFNKAFKSFLKKEYDKAIPQLKTIIETEPDFASPYFIMGLIGVEKDNPKMIEKYFPLVYRLCPQYNHPLLFYYLGLIDYSNEKFQSSSKHFEQFLQLSLHQEEYSLLQTKAINYIQWNDFLHEAVDNVFPFKPEIIHEISTDEDEQQATVSTDGNHIFFSRKVKTMENGRDSFYKQNAFTIKKTLCLSSKNEDGEFDRGFPVQDLRNIHPSFGRVCLTADNKEMYFSMFHKHNNTSSYDIFRCENINGYWSEPERVEIINSSSANEIQPHISSDGNTLYFASNREGSMGGYDIWVSHKSKNGTWMRPSNMGKRINTPGDELSPFLHPDNQSFYFSSDGWKSIGGKDLFYINLNDREMTEPKNIGAAINTEDDEQEIFLLKDGLTAYRTIKQNGKKDYDICTYPLPQSVRAKEVFVLPGKITDNESEEKKAQILLTDLSDNSTVSYYSNLHDGEFALALVKSDDYFISIKKEGYAYLSMFLDAEKDSIKMEIKQIQTGRTYPLNGINLNDKGELTEKSIYVLNDFMKFLKENPKIRIQLIGEDECCEKVSFYLTKSGIRKDRVNELFLSKDSPTLSYKIE